MYNSSKWVGLESLMVGKLELYHVTDTIPYAPVQQYIHRQVLATNHDAENEALTIAPVVVSCVTYSSSSLYGVHNILTMCWQH